MTSNIIELKQQINVYFHNIYLAKYPVAIHDMLIHLFNDGKRIRPILFIAFNHIIELSCIEKEGNNVLGNTWIEYAIEIELVHCLSLVIDDLPEMDNEVERRGIPCFHVVYGLQKTNFFLYYIFTKLSSNLTNLLEFHNNKNYLGMSNRILDDASFLIQYLINNLIDGQYIDITSNKLMSSNLQSVIDCNIVMIMKVIMSIYEANTESADIGKEHRRTIIENHIMLNIKKTGTLFVLPIITGFLFQLYKKNLEYTGKEVIQDEFYIPNTGNTGNIGNTGNTGNIGNTGNTGNIEGTLDLCDDNMVNLIITWASLLGFLFQTSDDFLDMDSDSLHNKPNICNIIGVYQSIKLLSKCTLIIRAMFEYIVQNTQKIWPDVIVNTENVNAIIDLIESRYQK